MSRLIYENDLIGDLKEWRRANWNLGFDVAVKILDGVIELVKKQPTAKIEPACIGKVSFDKDDLKELINEAKKEFTDYKALYEKAVQMNSDLTNQLMEERFKSIPVQNLVLKPTLEWIPSGEKLPEDGQTVLVTVEGEDENIVLLKTFWKDYHTTWDDIVMAWMPLPKAYEVKDETD